MKQLTKILLTLGIILSATPAMANVVWPSLYIARGTLSIKAILLGLIIEILFVKRFMNSTWIKAIWSATLMNIITCILGILLIPIEGLFVELVTMPLYDAFQWGTFHISHWITSFFLAILINTLIESLIIKLIFKEKYSKIFGWMFLANTISVLMGCLFYYKDINIDF